MIHRLVLILIFFATVGFSPFSRADVEIAAVQNGKAVSLMPWPKQAKFQLVPLKDNPGVEVLVQKVRIKLPASGAFVGAESEGSQLAVRNGNLDLYSNRMIETIRLKSSSGAVQTVRIRWTKVPGATLVGKCPKNTPQLDFGKNPAPFLVGVGCQLFEKGEKSAISISVPSDVEWGSYTLYDLGGKGESWRLFELPSASDQGGVIGEMTFQFQNKEYLAKLVAPKTFLDEHLKDKDKDKDGESNGQEKLFSFSFGLGTATVTTKADTVDSSSNPLFVDLGVQSKRFWGNTSAFAQVMTTVKMSSDEKSDTVTDFHLGAQYTFEFSSIRLSPELLFTIVDYQQTPSNVRLQSSQAGAGLALGVKVGSKGEVVLEAASTPLLSQFVKSHTYFSASYGHKFGDAKSPWTLGLGYSLQDYSAENASGVERKFSNSNIRLFVSY